MTFQIGGINCSGCTTNIEKKVTERYGESGLLEVVATFLTNKLCVLIKQEAQSYITPEAIEELVRDMGKTCDFQETKPVGGKKHVPRSSFKKIISGEHCKFGLFYYEWVNRCNYTT